jgi:hypothetical protein
MIDPSGLYEFGANVDATQKANFIKQMEEFKKRLDYLKKRYKHSDKNPSKEYLEAKASYDAICEGAKNCAETKGGRVRVETYDFKNSQDPKERNTGAEADRDTTTKQAVLRLDSTQLSKGFDMVRDIAHEGVHVVDQINFIDKGTQVTDYDTEFRGYTVTSLMDEAYQGGTSTKGGVTIWNPDWWTVPKGSKVSPLENVRNNRENAIDQILANEYNLKHKDSQITYFK